MTITFTAAVLRACPVAGPYRQSRPYSLGRATLPAPGPGEVLVEVRAAGLCHSDLSQLKGFRRRPLPLVGGHEGAGIVRALGPGVTRLAKGDHVVLTVAGGCGGCASCRDQHPALCKTGLASRSEGILLSGRRALSLEGAPAYHSSGISSFAEFALIAAFSAVRIDSDVPLEVAALFGCAVLTGAGAVLTTAVLRPGETVAVLGLGGTGLSAVMAARLSGATRIIGIDSNPAAFPLALDLGCTEVHDAREADLSDRMRALPGEGVDASFEMSGAASAFRLAFDIARRSGRVVCVGVGVGEAGAERVLPHAELVLSEKAVLGSYLGSGAPDRDLPRLMELYRAGMMPVDRMITHRRPLAEINEAFDDLAAGVGGRQVLLPHAS